MTISDEISKLQSNLANSYASCESKGATMPSSQNFDNLATTIDSIERGITPTGTISITANGSYNVTNYANADVSVAGITPTGTFNITANGTYDVTNYASANVNVEGSGGGIGFPAGTWLLTLNHYSIIEENQLKGAFQNLTSSSLKIGESYTATGTYEVKSKGLQEAFKGNTKTKTVTLWGIGTFATDSLLDCFLNSSVTTIWFAQGTNYTSTTGYSNKWGAPTATIRTEFAEPV